MPGGGDDTTTFSGGGGELERLPAPLDGMCTVPESRSRVIAAAPRSSAASGIATRRASTQIAPQLPRSLADTGPSLPPLPRP